MTTSTSTKPVTVRLPEDVTSFLASLPEKTTTAALIAAVRRDMRRCKIEREIEVYKAAGGDPYGIASQSAEQVAEVWKDLDW